MVFTSYFFLIEKLKIVYSALIYLFQIKDVSSTNHRIGKKKEEKKNNKFFSAIRIMSIIS